MSGPFNLIHGHGKAAGYAFATRTAIACGNHMLAAMLDERSDRGEAFTPQNASHIIRSLHDRTREDDAGRALRVCEASLLRVNTGVHGWLAAHGWANTLLDPQQTEQLVHGLSAVFGPQIKTLGVHNSGRRERYGILLYEDASLTVYLLAWTPGKWTHWHDHDCRSMAIRVHAGFVREEYLEGARVTRRLRIARTSHPANPTAIHRMGGGMGLTLHAYSGALSRMNRYRQTAGGRIVLRDAQPELEATWIKART